LSLAVEAEWEEELRMRQVVQVAVELDLLELTLLVVEEQEELNHLVVLVVPHGEMEIMVQVVYWVLVQQVQLTIVIIILLVVAVEVATMAAVVAVLTVLQVLRMAEEAGAEARA
jgi:hypothetical protein